MPNTSFTNYYTDEKVASLSRAFDLVADAEHWKNPVHGVVDAADLEDVLEAVIFYTATVATATLVEDGPDQGRYLVEAAGYYAGPAC